MELARIPRAFRVGAAFWIALCVASLAWSVDPGYTLAELRREILYGGIAFIVFFAGTREPAQLHLWMQGPLRRRARARRGRVDPLPLARRPARERA